MTASFKRFPFFRYSHWLLSIAFFLTIDQASAQPLEAIDTIFSKLVTADNFSGAVILAKNGTIIYNKTAGYADREANKPFTNNTTSSIASVGKMFTAVIIQKLAENGKLDLNKTVRDYLPALKIPNAEKITIAQLLTHTSGLGNYMTHPNYATVTSTATSPDVFIPLIEELPQVFSEPGSRHVYSNSGYIILGKVIEAITKKKYTDVVNEWIVKPAGMQQLNYTINRKAFGNNAKGYVKQGQTWVSTEAYAPFPASDGGVFTTAMDLFKFDKALYNNRIISQTSLAEMQNNNVEAEMPGMGKMRYGFGTMRFDYSNGAYSWGHNGGFPGYACEFKHYFLPDGTQYTLVILANYDRVVRPLFFGIQKLILQQKI